MGFEIRPDIAAMLSTVDGVTGYEQPPATARTGDAFPQWNGGEAVAPGLFETGWVIHVLLPEKDVKARDTWINAHIGLLVEALQPILWTLAVGPGTWQETPTLMLTCKE